MPFGDNDADDDLSLDGNRGDTDATVGCPYCGEVVEIALDPGGGARQDYVEDCEVCCQPWRVSVHYTRDGRAHVAVATLDGE
ncbi:MAG: CPXCG motif-containing cysteine-rich protein [Gemmatimonadaceae bacterium]